MQHIKFGSLSDDEHLPKRRVDRAAANNGVKPCSLESTGAPCDNSIATILALPLAAANTSSASILLLAQTGVLQIRSLVF